MPDVKPTSGWEIARAARVKPILEFVVVICGGIMTMSGFLRVPRAEHMRLAPGGYVGGI